MALVVARALAPAGAISQDRADVFARGETAVLVVADGAGGVARGGAAADLFFDSVRSAVLDDAFDLLAARRWEDLFANADRELRAIGETTAVVVAQAPGVIVCVASGDSEAWIVRPDDVERLTGGASRRLGGGASPRSVVRGELDGRLVVATDGLFRHVAEAAILALLRDRPFGGLADALIEAARMPSGALADDIAVLVAER
ncbi:MAG: SpoIIE family protein phosphatase [Labilithrix sp.]|nr:SpoIIE family protein phosphatase [Labilithrix sp.]